LKTNIKNDLEKIVEKIKNKYNENGYNENGYNENRYNENRKEGNF
jgi:hypothetical protein